MSHFNVLNRRLTITALLQHDIRGVNTLPTNRNSLDFVTVVYFGQRFNFSVPCRELLYEIMICTREHRFHLPVQAHRSKPWLDHTLVSK